MLVYNQETGNIIAKIPKDQDYKFNFKHYPIEFVNNLKVLKDSNISNSARLTDYKVIDNKLTERPKFEILEINRYGRVLTEEERLLNKLSPSPEEIQKARNTIEILTLIQEVM